MWHLVARTIGLPRPATPERQGEHARVLPMRRASIAAAARPVRPPGFVRACRACRAGFAGRGTPFVRSAGRDELGASPPQDAVPGRVGGFTFIELMVVLVIIGLAA